jgi:hypothetical protein
MNNPVMDIIARAKLVELAKFFQQPPEQIAQVLPYVVEPMKLSAILAIMMSDPDDDEPVPVPRSWPKSEWGHWDSLSRPVQRYLAKREVERDRSIRNSQNHAAELRREVERLKLLLEKENNNGEETDFIPSGPLLERGAEAAEGQASQGAPRA